MAARVSQAHPASDLPPLELAVDDILARVGGQRELLATLAGLQSNESRRAVREIAAFLSEGDTAHVERVAHRLVGSLLIFGADAAVAAARQLEREARDGQLAGAREWLARLSLELERLDAALALLARSQP